MRRTAGIGILVLAAVLLGTLAAGTPVAGNDSVAAVTAGIELGTTPARVAPSSSALVRVVPATIGLLVSLLRLLVAAAALFVATRQHLPTAHSVLRWQSASRRGPPALA